MPHWTTSSWMLPTVMARKRKQMITFTLATRSVHKSRKKKDKKEAEKKRKEGRKRKEGKRKSKEKETKD